MQWEQDDIYSPEADEPNWSEEDWEQFFQEQDHRAEQYQKKFEEAYGKYKEQYTDDEELSKKIQSDLEPHHPATNPQWLELAEQAHQEYLSQEPWEAEQADLEMNMENAELEALPAYQYSMQFGLDTPHFIKPLYEKGLDTPELHQLHFHCYQIAAHVAGGHALGYDKDGLTGNIAKLKRALKSAHLCLEALDAIKRKHLSNDDTVNRLIQQIILVRDSLIHRIVELRKKVWW